MATEDEMIAVQIRAPKREIDKLCENTLTDVRAQAIMIAVRRTTSRRRRRWRDDAESNQSGSRDSGHGYPSRDGGGVRVALLRHERVSLGVIRGAEAANQDGN